MCMEYDDTEQCPPDTSFLSSGKQGLVFPELSTKVLGSLTLVLGRTTTRSQPTNDQEIHNLCYHAHNVHFTTK